MANVLCVLYPDPETGYPPRYARDSIPTIRGYANGQTAPTPKGLGFKPGELVGSVSGELGLRSYLEKLGHELIVTSDKDGPGSKFEQHLPDAEIIISQPFWPAYLPPSASPRQKSYGSRSRPGLDRTMSICKRPHAPASLWLRSRDRTASASPSTS
jgi:hypothetical protein